MEIFSDDSVFVPRSDPSAGRMEWLPKTRASKGVRYLPRLKIFASELAFLTLIVSRCSIDMCVIVYAGAAGGNHIPILSALYPKTHFYLYDTRHFPFHSSEKITIFHKKFTDATALEWKISGKTVIFISDIRTTGLEGEAYEDAIENDMRAQARWVNIIQPIWYKVTCRFPYPVVEKGEKYHYLAGWLMFQPFTKPLSMQMSLVGNQDHAREGVDGTAYDTREIEQLLLYHNKVVRPKKDMFCNVYSFDKSLVECGEINFDTTYVLHVLDAYQRISSRRDHEGLEFVKSLLSQ